MLDDPGLKRELQRLRQTDNLTNWYYIGQAWCVIAVSVVGAIAFQQWQQAAGHAWWWNVPVFALAVAAIGAAQHQLSGATHEAVHHILFQNRMLNELASDWFCMFPLFSSTYHYRLQHLAHHQFINDPERDPDLAQLRASGHWLEFPVTPGVFAWSLIRQLWPWNLVRYIHERARYNALGGGKLVYARAGESQSRLRLWFGLTYLIALIGTLNYAAQYDLPWLLAAAPLGLWAVGAATLAAMPERCFRAAKLQPAVPIRTTAQLRLVFLTLLFTALAVTTWATGVWAGKYLLLLWVLPALTTYSFFMILRQVVQHGNGDRGWLTNTRVFFVHPLIRYAVFPFGMDYHLPHHMFATVPHYRLAELHRVLSQYADYAASAQLVEGYFLPQHRPAVHPTVVEVLGPDYAPREERLAVCDHSVLDDCVVDDKAALVADRPDEIPRDKTPEIPETVAADEPASVTAS